MISKMNPQVDLYFVAGCGRCPLGGTPKCKVNNWVQEMKQLRRIVLDCGLTEELKWSVPCYTYKNKNVLILAAFKEYCALSFFKGALLNDANGMLSKPGENTQLVRLIRFTNVRQIAKMEQQLKATIYAAIELEKVGLKVEIKKPATFEIAEEFKNKLDSMQPLKAAFEALTPGRQRGYHLYISAPKQSKTREARVEKCIQQILNGKGLNDE